MNDYVCWSAPEGDLSDWRYEGIIYKKTQDPLNINGDMCLFAPDVVKIFDGRYYLYYVLHKLDIISVAVCDTPAGKYEFYGYVHYKDGTKLGDRKGDEKQFDPAVLIDNNKLYLYSGGTCGKGDTSRHGAMVTILDNDMITIAEEPVFIMISEPYSKGSGYEGHEFFEASSIRKKGDKYYFIYSSINYCELCYAISDNPVSGFEFKGTIICNNDMYIDKYKRCDMPAYYGGNNHGSIIEINNQWYVFYHRHTNGCNFSRQDCIEKIYFNEDGTIPQVEMTSCGANDGNLKGIGEYPAYIACNLFTKDECAFTGWKSMDEKYPIISQDGKDDEKLPGYIKNMRDSATAGFKYFNFNNVNQITLKVRGNGDGLFEVKNNIEGPVLCKVKVAPSDNWKEFSSNVIMSGEKKSLFLTYRGNGHVDLLSFKLE